MPALVVLTLFLATTALWLMAIPSPMGIAICTLQGCTTPQSLRASLLKRSNVRAIVLFNAPNALA